MKIRVKEMRWMLGADLTPHPKNWKNHPLKQVEAFKALVNEIGFADVLLGYDREDGTTVIIDGHMRAGLLPNETLPVVILDLTDEEAEAMLGVVDTLGSMAEFRLERLEQIIQAAPKRVQDIMKDVPDLDMVLQRAQRAADAAKEHMEKHKRIVECPSCGEEFEV